MPETLNFLQELREDTNTHRGYRGYSAICTARSALSSFINLPGNIKLGDHPQVKQYIRGVYNIDAPEPRYVQTWDPGVVIKMFKSKPWFPAKNIGLLQLTMKVVMLILLITSQRGQIIQALNLDNMAQLEDSSHFKIKNKDLKQGRPSYKPNILKLKSYSDKKLCVVRYMRQYLERTAELRGDCRQLFITTTKPHRAATRNTISRWVKKVLQTAGVSTVEFAAGSTRAAASSKANRAGVPIDEILKAGGWSQENTFTKWYKRNIIDCNSNQVAEAVLEG